LNVPDGSLVYQVTRQIPAQSIDPRIKNRSRMYQAIAEREAADVEPGAAALLLDTNGHVAEGTGWNVFLARGGSLFTPSPENCLEGVSRSVAIDLCAEIGVGVQESIVWPYDLATADEVFATATSYCILPVTRVQRRPVADGRPGRITGRLLEAWSRRVGVDIVVQAKARARASAPARA
jgi:branched-chain amino acid aminotransferase